MEDKKWWAEVYRIKEQGRMRSARLDLQLKRALDAARQLNHEAAMLIEVSEPSVPNIVPRQYEVAQSLKKAIERLDSVLHDINYDLQIIRSEARLR